MFGEDSRQSHMSSHVSIGGFVQCVYFIHINQIHINQLLQGQYGRELQKACVPGVAPV